MLYVYMSRHIMSIEKCFCPIFFLHAYYYINAISSEFFTLNYGYLKQTGYIITLNRIPFVHIVFVF